MRYCEIVDGFTAWLIYFGYSSSGKRQKLMGNYLFYHAMISAQDRECCIFLNQRMLYFFTCLFHMNVF